VCEKYNIFTAKIFTVMIFYCQFGFAYIMHC